MAATAPVPSIVTDELLERCGSRVATYDRENRFFGDDFKELHTAGYLRLNVPEELGGLGMSLLEVCREQRRLAYRAPADALALNMHLIETGAAADLRRAGDTSLEWVLREAVAGEVIAAGRSEAGVDMPVLLSTSRAERVDGGYRFWGHKIFGSMTPVWTRLAIYGTDTSDARGPQMVHAYMPRETPGYTIKETWDTMGMRPTRSDDTILEGAFVPDRYIVRVLPAGTADLFVLSIFAWAEPTFASIYLGIAERARDLAIAAVKQRSSIALTRSMAHHPEIQHYVAEMVMELEPLIPYVERVAEDWDNGVDHGDTWGSRLVAVKHRCTVGAQRVVDLAMTISGGTGMFKTNELERLYRDVRCGPFHPANPMLTHEIVGKTALGIDWLGDRPRWG